MGEPKHLAKKLIYDIFHKFRVRGQVNKRPVPHVTLFGPFGCNNIRQVIHDISEIGSEYSELEYEINGFDYFELKKKIYSLQHLQRKMSFILNLFQVKILKISDTN